MKLSHSFIRPMPQFGPKILFLNYGKNKDKNLNLELPSIQKGEKAGFINKI